MNSSILETSTTCRSLLYTTPTGTPLRRTVSNATVFRETFSPGLRNANTCRERARGGNQENRKELKRPAKQMIGARKVWGTRNGVTCDEVTKAMMRIAGKLPTAFSVMKRIASVNGKKLWFIAKAPERSLQCVDKAWNHRFWQWQRVLGSSGGSSFYFLGLPPVSTRHR